MASEWLNWCEYSYKYALECHTNNYKWNIRTKIYDFWGERDLDGMAPPGPHEAIKTHDNLSYATKTSSYMQTEKIMALMNK